MLFSPSQAISRLVGRARPDVPAPNLLPCSTSTCRGVVLHTPDLLPVQSLSPCPAPRTPSSHVQPSVHQRHGRVCRASATSAASPLPGSQQEAVDEAVQCLTTALKPRLQVGKAPSKGFAAPATSTTQEALHVEIPTADTSANTVAQLAVSVTASLISSMGNSATPLLMVCADPAVAKAAGSLKGKLSGFSIKDLKEACRAPQLEGNILFLVAPATSDVALCQQLTEETWRGKAVVMINAQFLSAPPAALNLPVTLYEYVDQISTVYAVMPVQVKGLLGNMEGVVIRKVTGQGNETGSLWKIFMGPQGPRGEYMQIGQSKRRPTSDDLQLAFINANASKSPLTKLVSKFKGK